MLLGTYRALLDLFDRRERRRFYLLCALMVAMGVIEALGVASILPFLAVVARPSIIEDNELFARAYALSGADGVNDFLVLLGFAVFGLFLLSLAMKTLTTYGLARFANMRGFSLSTRLMRRYLAEPYAWHLQRNSADLAKVVLDEVQQLIGRTMLPALNLLKAAVVSVFLVGLIVVVDPQVAVVAAGLLGCSYLLIYRFARVYMTRLGIVRNASVGLRYRLVQEAFGGVKEIKTLGVEDRYAARFLEPALRTAEADAMLRVVSETPRHLLEAIAFGGMLSLVLFQLVTRQAGLDALLPVLGLYAFAGVRLFPAMQQIYQQMTSIRFSAPLLASVHRELTAATVGAPSSAERRAPLRLTQRLELIDLRYRYPGAARDALDGVTIAIPAQTSVGFVGGTGAGKTTAIDVIMGLLEPRDGALVVDGIRIDGTNAPAWRRSIGYVPQQIYLADASVAENIAFGRDPDSINMAAVERAARIAELHHFVTDDLPQAYDTMVGERGVRLSGGQRQRIGIARALYHDPDVLVLDEATSALDNLTEQAVMDTLDHLGRVKTVIIIAHRLSTVRHCDTIFLMDRGRIAAQGDYEGLLARSPLFRRMAGVAIKETSGASN